MVDIINLYENPWDIASSGTDTLPRGLNPNVYTTAAGYPYGITNPSLYRPLFSSRLATLSDAISCVITEEINGIYTLDMTYPVDGNGAGLIKAGRIIAAKNYPKGSRQLFKITQISKTLKNTITVRGEHLSYDLSDYTLQPITGGAQDQETGELKPIQATLDKAIEYIQGEDIYYEDVGTFNPGWIVGDIYNRTPPYTEQGDQPSVQTFPFRFQVANTYYDDNNVEHSTYDYRNAVKEIYSDKIGTVREYVGAAKTGLLSVYGGEVIFDIDDGGYANVIFTPQMGMDRGFKVVYGKNLKSMNYKIQAGKQKSAWFPYYKYTMNSDLHINLFWEIDNDLSSERARQIIGSGVSPYEGQIKPPLVYEHMDDFQSYVNIFPVDVTSEVDQFLKLIGESWGHITPDSHDQPGEAEDKSIMRSWALSVGLSAYWDINGTLGYAPMSSELTFDFASLYATDSNAVEADVRLGDTVTVLYDEDGTSVKKRVIKIEYDAATGRYKKITLGDPKNKRKTAAGSIAESSLNSVVAIDTAYANAASFNRDVLSLIGEAFNTNLTVKTPLEKTYSVDSISKKPSMGLEIKGTTNDDGKCLTWRHNISDDTWSAVWEEVSRDHYTGQAPIRINDQNVISLSYDSTSLAVTQGSPYKLYIKNPVPAYEERNDGQYLRVYYDPETTDISIGWYSMSLATPSVVGGIKIGYQPAANTKNYAVQLSDGKAYVNVPWTDTKYSAGTGISINNRNEINVLRPVPAYTDTEVGKVLKVFTADPDGEYLDWSSLTTSDISNIETWISGKSYATTTYVNEIASGLSAAYSVRVGQNPSFNSQSDYITITGPITTTTGASIPLSSLKVGDVVYVIDTDIPDRWVSAVTSSSATLYTLETVKPAVTDVQINSSSIVSNRVANIALSSSFSFNTTNNTLSLQKAGSSTLGGIKTGYVPVVGSKDYAVMVDTNGNAHVIVPWESVPNGTNAGDVLRWSAENLAWEASEPSWYLASNPDHYISRSGIDATAPITYNSSNGKIGISLGSGLTTTGTPAQLILDTEYLDQNYVNNPMTNVGDLIVGGTGGEPTAISKGSAGQVLSSTANGLAWITLPSDTNTWRDVGVNGEPWKGTGINTGAIDFTDNTGIAITTGTGQDANKLYIGLANTYGDSKNPYGSKTAHYVLAAPSNQNGVPTFRVLDASDIPNLSYTKITGIGATAPISYTGGTIALSYDDTLTNDGGTLSVNVATILSGYATESWVNNQGFLKTVSLSMAQDNGTPAITLAANRGYKITTNGTTYIFKTPADNDTLYTLNVSGTGANAGKVGLVAGGSGSGTTWYTIPYATVAGEATKDSDSNTIADYYGHALTVSGNTIGLKNAQDDDITGSFITVPYATVAGSASSVTWANVSGHATGVKADLAINATSGSTSKYLSEKGTWVSLPSDVNTWRPVKYGSTTLNDTSTTLEFVAGTNIGLAFSSGKLTITNNYSYMLPLAANGTRGGIQIGYSPAANTKKYAVKLESEKAYVEVPWTDTTYSLAVGTGSDSDKIVLNQNGTAMTPITVPYATVAGKATNDDANNQISSTYGHSLIIDGNTIGLENGNGDTISGSFITVPYATNAGTAASASSVAWANVSGHDAGVDSDLGINTSSGSTTKYLSQKGTWVSLPSDVNTWRDIGVNGDPWKGTGTGTGPIDFTNDTGISITTGTGQDANKLYIGHSNSITAVTTAGFYKFKFDAQGHITGTASVAASDIPNLAASKITSGTFDAARIPSLSYTKITGISGTSPISYSGGAISLSNAYGDTKNPYGTKTPNYVLAGPASGTTAAAPTFRALVAKDIPNLTSAKITDLGDVATLGIGDGLQNDGGNLAIDSSYISGLDTWRPVKYSTTTLSDKTTTLEFVAGTNIGLSFTSGKLTITNNYSYSLPLAANGTRGGIQIGFTTNATNRNYAVQLSSEKAYVNVPWTDTTYSFQEGSTDGGFQYKVNSGSWQNVAIHNAATIAYVNEKAAGLSASYAINTSSSVNPAFNVQTASITVTSFVTTGGTTIQASSLKVGDTVYVTNSDIPDRWVGAVTSSNATLYILETAKPAVVDVKFDSTSLLNTSTRVATLNHGKAISFNTTDKTISVNIDTNTMAYVDSDTKIGVDTTKVPLITSLGDLAWLDTITNAKITGGTSGYLLKSNGTSAASWVSPSTLTVSHAATAESIYDPEGQVTYTIEHSVPSDAVFTDTTYTFANGTNGFTVTPAGGTAQTVTVTPSISDNITGTGTRTSGYLAKFSGTNTITNAVQYATHATNGTIAQRTENGYLLATYFNTSVGEQNPASYTSSPAFIDSNGYLRKSSKATFMNWINPDIQAYEAKLQWGGRNFSGSYGPIDAAMIGTLGANRFELLRSGAADNPGIEVFYSRDAGSTWIDYGLNGDQKRNIFNSTAGNAVVIGKRASSDTKSVDDRAKIVIHTGLAGVYTQLNKFALYVSTGGSRDCWVTIDKCIQNKDYSVESNWENVVTKVPISGWSGWNIINTSNITTYGNTPASQYGHLRFIFGADIATDTSYLGLQAVIIAGFGGVGWSTPSYLAKYGHAYTWNYAGDVTFQAGLAAYGSITANARDGTASTTGITYLIAGNSTASGTVNNSRGALRLYGTGSGYANIFYDGSDSTSSNYVFPVYSTSQNVASVDGAGVTSGTLAKFDSGSGHLASLTNGSNGQILAIVNGALTWSGNINALLPSYSSSDRGKFLVVSEGDGSPAWETLYWSDISNKPEVTEVKLNAKTDSSNYRVLLGPSSPTDGSTSEAYYANTEHKRLSFNPYNGDLLGIGLINGNPLGSLFSVSPNGDGGYLLYDPDDPDYQYQWVTPPNDKVSMTANTGSTALPVLLGPSTYTSGNAYGANYANVSGKQLKFTPSTGNLSGVAQINGSAVTSSPKFTDTLADYISTWYSGQNTGFVKYAYNGAPDLYVESSVGYDDLSHTWNAWPGQGTAMLNINNQTTQTSNNWLTGWNFHAPNMTSSTDMGYANFAAINLGKNGEARNSGSIVFHYAGNNALGNCITFGLSYNDHILQMRAGVSSTNLRTVHVRGNIYAQADSTSNGIGNLVATQDWVKDWVNPTCLIKGTKILMADGTEKNIEDVKRGDEVKSIDINSGKIITAMIVSCEKTGLNHEYTTHLFDNGSYIVTYGQHSVYNKTLGHPIDISKFRIGDETYDADGKVITYAGNMRYYDRSADVAHYDINTSNNLYFANGILNGKNVFAKYRYMRRENMDIPDSILAVLNRQETANKPAIGYETDSNYFRAIAAKLKEKSTIAKRIEDAKQKLADSDYLVAKFTEGLINAVDWLKAKAERGNWRTAINNDEPLLEAADNAIKVIKAKYQTDDSSVKDRFELFSAWDNAALEYYREWLTKEKSIDIPGPLTEEERRGSYANQDLT